MSVEMFSGNIEDFEAAIQRCPFLNSLGESALADIKAELGVSPPEEPVAVVEKAPIGAGPKPNKTEVVHTHESENISARPEQSDKAGLGVEIERSVINDRGEYEPAPDPYAELFVREQLATNGADDPNNVVETVRLQATVDEVKNEHQPDKLVTFPLAKDQALKRPVETKAPKVLAIPKTTVAHVTTKENIRESDIDNNAQTAESLTVITPTEQQITNMPEAEFIEEAEVPDFVVEPVAAAGSETAVTVEVILRQRQSAKPEVETNEVQAETSRPKPLFTEEIQGLIEQQLPPEKQAVAEGLLEQATELAAKVGDVQTPEAEEELTQIVVELLQALGVDQPASEQVQRFIALLKAEIEPAPEVDDAEEYIDDGMHEWLHDFIAPPAVFHWPHLRRHKFIGRLALAQPPAAA